MNQVAEHRPIEIITSEIKFYTNQAGMSIIEIGKRLHEAKLCLPHGAWGDWLKNEVRFSERTAQNFMRIAREYQNPQLLSDLGNSATKALLLLSLPPEEREEFVAQPHEVSGETKTAAEMTARELEQLVKQLEAERAEKDQLQSQLALFREEAQKEKDEAVDAAHYAAEERVNALQNQKDAALQAQHEAEERVAAMQAEMDELRMQTTQTALPDADELERVRQEAEKAATEKAQAAMQKKLDKAKADAKKAKQEAAEAQAAIEAHEAAQKEAEEKLVQLQEQLVQEHAAFEQRLKTASSTSAAEFKVHLQAVQDGLDAMLDCIKKAEENGEGDMAQKMKKLAGTLCRNVQGCL